ncbi:MAG: hypothetical protein ACTSWW_07300 [Promethearchaeota archaeon]
MSNISAIQPTSTIVESKKRFFQTTNLIITHLKRKGDRKRIFDLIGENTTLLNLLVASTAIHCYHDLGIRTKSDEQNISQVNLIAGFEAVQKKQIYAEIHKLVGEAVIHELDLSKNILGFEEQILTLMVAKTDTQTPRFQEQMKDQVEENLVSSLNQYPPVFWLDYVGDLTGYTTTVKNEIFSKFSSLRATASDLETDLLSDTIQNQLIELPTLKSLFKKMKHDFEFSSMRDLKIENFPIRRITNQILKHHLNYYPISQDGLRAFLAGNALKNRIHQKLGDAYNTSINYPKLEQDIIALISKETQKQALKGSQNLVYFLQNVLELTFEDTYLMLSRYGVANVPLFCHILGFDHQKFMKDADLNQLTKMNFLQMESQDHELFKAEKALNILKTQKMVTITRSVKEILQNRIPEEIQILKSVCQKNNIDYPRLVTTFQKKQLVRLIIHKKYPLKGPASCYSMVFDLPEILENLSRNIYFMFFQKICRQIARILETYVELSNDKRLFLPGIKITSDPLQEEWVSVKIEELIIQRLMHRQKELAMVFNAENDAYLVNSFILARLMEIDMQSALEIFQNEPSPVYEKYAELVLPPDLISPVSYVISYDLLIRLKSYLEYAKVKHEQVLVGISDEDKERKKKLKVKQQLSTLNSIEKKIASTLISLSAISVNPTRYYWNETDSKNTINNLINHSSLVGKKVCPECGSLVKEETCSECGATPRDANPVDLFAQFHYFALKRMKFYWEKLKLPEFSAIYDQVLSWVKEEMAHRLRRDIVLNDSFQMIEGERREVAKKIAISIGKRLDKIIYKKFKTNLKKAK